MGVVIKSAPENTINMPFRRPQNSIFIPLPNGRGPQVKFKFPEKNGRGHFLESQGQIPRSNPEYAKCPYTPMSYTTNDRSRFWSSILP